MCLAGADLAQLLHMPADLADKLVLEWGVQNKYHRKRFLRKLGAAFRADAAEEEAAARLEEEEEGQVATDTAQNHDGALQDGGVGCTGTGGRGTPRPMSPTGGLEEAQGGSRPGPCSWCEELVATHACEQCGVLCSHCAESHLKMSKGPFADHRIAHL